MTAIASSQLPSSLAPAGCYAGSHAAHQLSPQQFSFLLTFQQHVQPKLRSLMELLASQQVSSSLALAQVIEAGWGAVQRCQHQLPWQRACKGARSRPARIALQVAPAPTLPQRQPAGVDLPAGAAGGAAGAQGGAAVPAGRTSAGGLPHRLVSGRLGLAIYPLAFPFSGCLSARLAAAAQLVDTSLLPPPHLPARCCPRLRSAEEGVPAHLLGPMSKAWEGGVVKVVQSLENLSRETHPCNRLQGEAHPCSGREAGALGAAICLQRTLTPARRFLPPIPVQLRLLPRGRLSFLPPPHPAPPSPTNTRPAITRAGPLESSVAELVYVPIFDRGPCAASGVVAVLELLVSSRAHDFVAVADAISCAARLMDALQVGDGFVGGGRQGGPAHISKESGRLGVVGGGRRGRRLYPPNTHSADPAALAARSCP